MEALVAWIRQAAASREAQRAREVDRARWQGSSPPSHADFIQSGVAAMPGVSGDVVGAGWQARWRWKHAAKGAVKGLRGGERRSALMTARGYDEGTEASGKHPPAGEEPCRTARGARRAKPRASPEQARPRWRSWWRGCRGGAPRGPRIVAPRSRASGALTACFISPTAAGRDRGAPRPAAPTTDGRTVTSDPPTRVGSGKAMIPGVASRERQPRTVSVEVDGNDLEAQQQRLHRIIPPGSVADRLRAHAVDLVRRAPRFPIELWLAEDKTGGSRSGGPLRQVLELSDGDDLHAGTIVGPSRLSILGALGDVGAEP